MGGWVGGLVGGGEAAWGAWGSQPGGTTPPRPHRTYRILPHPGGVSGAYQRGRPVYVGPRPLRHGCVLDSLPPREPTSRLADKGRLGSLGGWRAGL